MVSGASRAGEGDNMSKAMENAKRIADGDYDLHKAELDGCVSAVPKPAQTEATQVAEQFWPSWEPAKLGSPNEMAVPRSVMFQFAEAYAAYVITELRAKLAEQAKYNRLNVDRYHEIQDLKRELASLRAERDEMIFLTKHAARKIAEEVSDLIAAEFDDDELNQAAGLIQSQINQWLKEQLEAEPPATRKSPA
jgi:hypothetical protein